MAAEIAHTRSTSPKPALPGFRRSKTAEPRMMHVQPPGLIRNNSIDPNSLAQKPRRMRNRPAAATSFLHDSGLTTSSVDSSCSFASRWSSSNHESIKFSVQTFVNQKQGTLESSYEMGNLIGEGGFGEVYSCYHIETGEERAVKVMEKSLNKEHINEEIVKEYNILKELDHPK